MSISSNKVSKKSLPTSTSKKTKKATLQASILKAEIDDLFSKKLNRDIKEAAEEKEKKKKPETKKNKISEIDSFGDVRGLHKRPTRLTEDGLPIWTDKEMKIGLGGGTPECPFDCDCCF